MTRSQNVEHCRHSLVSVRRISLTIGGIYRRGGHGNRRLLLLAPMTEPAAILVVEDDAPTRTFLADNLTADGYHLLVAATLRDALRTLEYHHVDIAVVDVGLPDGSGLELLRKVREAGGSGSRIDARLPLIVVSGRAGETDRVRGFERGADDYVSKPTAS